MWPICHMLLLYCIISLFTRKTPRTVIFLLKAKFSCSAIDDICMSAGTHALHLCMIQKGVNQAIWIEVLYAQAAYFYCACPICPHERATSWPLIDHSPAMKLHHAIRFRALGSGACIFYPQTLAEAESYLCFKLVTLVTVQNFHDPMC